MLFEFNTRHALTINPNNELQNHTSQPNAHTQQYSLAPRTHKNQLLQKNQPKNPSNYFRGLQLRAASIIHKGALGSRAAFAQPARDTHSVAAPS